MGHFEKVSGNNGKNPRARDGKVKMLKENGESDTDMNNLKNIRELYPTPSVIQLEAREANNRPKLESVSSADDNMTLMVNKADNQIMRYWACAYINNTPLTMMVDTGSPISIIPDELAEKVFNLENENWERETSNIYQDFNGNPVEQAGVLQTDVDLNS